MNGREIGITEKYTMLKDNISRMWGMKKMTVVSVIVGKLGAISNGFEKYTAVIGTDMKAEHEQKVASLRIARIFRLALGC